MPEVITIAGNYQVVLYTARPSYTAKICLVHIGEDGFRTGFEDVAKLPDETWEECLERAKERARFLTKTFD